MKAARILVAWAVIAFILAGCGGATGKPKADRQAKPVSISGEKNAVPNESVYLKNWRNDYASNPFSEKDLVDSIRLTDDQFFKKYGEGRLIRLTEEGIQQGYLYMSRGVCVSFDEKGRVLAIDCRDGFEFRGAKAGMGFDKVRTILGEASVRAENFGGRKVHILEYTLEECTVQFIAGDRGGKNDGASFLRVRPQRDVLANLKREYRQLAGTEVSEPGTKPDADENPVDAGGWRKTKYQYSPLGKEELIGLVSLTKGEILNKYGYDYTIVRTGAEGLMQGYFFPKLGVCINFWGYDKVSFVECCQGVGIDGATVGISFAEVMARLGEVPIKAAWWESPDIKTHVLEYSMGSARVNFISLAFRPNYHVWKMLIYPKKIVRE